MGVTGGPVVTSGRLWSDITDTHWYSGIGKYAIITHVGTRCIGRSVVEEEGCGGGVLGRASGSSGESTSIGSSSPPSELSSPPLVNASSVRHEFRFSSSIAQRVWRDCTSADAESHARSAAWSAVLAAWSFSSTRMSSMRS